MKNYNPNPLAAWLSAALLRWVSVVSMWIFGHFRWQYESFVNNMGHFYLWYSIWAVGIIIWFLRAIVDAFCSTFVLVRLYNVANNIIKK